MDTLFEQLAQHNIQQLRRLAPQLDERAARRLLEAHLAPACFAMPIHDTATEQQLITWSRGDEDIANATCFLRFEETRTIRGIARVLARSAINRQGVADVTRNARWKVQSPRVTGIFDLAPDDTTLRRWVDYTPLLDAFLELARRNSTPAAAADAHFAPLDIVSLEALARLTPRRAREIQVGQVPGLDKPGWGRVILSLYTGLCYLDDRFGFDARRVWAALEAATSAADVDALAQDAQHHITEFGAALTPSFFADLGCASFVKADVHVSDVVQVMLDPGHVPSAQECIDFVRQMALQTGRSPRAIDKLMYLACSGKFYLAGLAPSKAEAQAGKHRLLQVLRGQQTTRQQQPKPLLQAPSATHDPAIETMDSAKGLFHKRLEVAPTGLKIVVAQLETEFGTSDELELHYTGTNKGDLRIRSFAIPRGQNIFTLAWQPQKQVFRCRAYASVAKCREHGLLASQPVSSSTEPLRTQFDFGPSDDVRGLVAIIRASSRQLYEEKG